MAEDQDKQKPKTTLIKHRKDEHEDDGDRKKVRVVVRRKVTKQRAKPAETESTSAPAAAPRADKPSGTEYRPSVVRKADEIPPSVREQPRPRKQEPAPAPET